MTILSAGFFRSFRSSILIFIFRIYQYCWCQRKEGHMALTRNSKTLVSTVECYDAWSNTYDSDGNVLQLLDDKAFQDIAEPLLNSIHQNSPIQICCELGCGTGRNTIKVLHAGWSVVSINIHIYIENETLRTYRFLVYVYEQTQSVYFNNE